ncbi:MAG TPA: spondin domain-containing protein [Gemmatimonadaceae bacterium]|nr:spondin domain-containing protein [Gemmatimonadaceae bacterium]
MHQITRFTATAILAIGAVAAAACDDDDDEGPSGPVSTTFTVTIENVSTQGTLAVTRLDGVVPLSPGVWAVYTNLNPLFLIGEPVVESLERLAEDGDNAAEGARVAGLTAAEGGTFEAPGGADNSPLIFPGETVTFTFSAVPGDRLMIETMFAQSNDWFFAFSGAGLDLFDGSTPVTGDVTSQIVLYDAGTEADTPPGTGPDQAPVQAAPNTGAADPDSTLRLVPVTDTTLALPPLTSIIRVTITAQ